VARTAFGAALRRELHEVIQQAFYAESISGAAVEIHACSRTEPLDAGVVTRPSADSDGSDDMKKSMLAGQKALRKELVLLRKLLKRTSPAMP
jgi:hypothetical protein